MGHHFLLYNIHLQHQCLRTPIPRKDFSHWFLLLVSYKIESFWEEFEPIMNLLLQLFRASSCNSFNLTDLFLILLAPLCGLNFTICFEIFPPRIFITIRKLVSLFGLFYCSFKSFYEHFFCYRIATLYRLLLFLQPLSISHPFLKALTFCWK